MINSLVSRSNLFNFQADGSSRFEWLVLNYQRVAFRVKFGLLDQSRLRFVALFHLNKTNYSQVLKIIKGGGEIT